MIKSKKKATNGDGSCSNLEFDAKLLAAADALAAAA